MSEPLLSMTRDELLTLLTDTEAHIAALQALQIRALAAAAVDDDTDESTPFDPDNDKQYVREEIAAALHWSPGTTAVRLHEAETLVERLPGTLRLLGGGQIGFARAHALADVVARSGLDAAGAFELESQVLERAPGQTAAELRRCARRAAAAIDPRDAQHQHEDAVSERRVGVQPDEHAMAWVSAYLPAADAQTIWLATQAVADTLPADDRSADQRRADAFTAVLNGAVIDNLPHWHGRRPTIQVSVALSTLLGLDEQPADLDGYGPIPAGVARRIAADLTGTWRRLLTDDAGRLLFHGRTRYRPPQDLLEHVIARDRTCRAPGCGRPARRSEIDHIVPFDGTNTTEANLQALCSRHHVKHDTDWTIHRLPDGITRWTTPTGRTHDKPPDPYPIDRTRPKIHDPAPF